MVENLPSWSPGFTSGWEGRVYNTECFLIWRKLGMILARVALPHSCLCNQMQLVIAAEIRYVFTKFLKTQPCSAEGCQARFQARVLRLARKYVPAHERTAQRLDIFSDIFGAHIPPSPPGLSVRDGKQGPPPYQGLSFIRMEQPP